MEQIKCKVCGKTFTKNHKKGNVGYICNSCRQRYRQLKLKVRAIEYKGSKCEICGYNKNISALEFHHINPEEKDFAISGSLNKSWKLIQKELNKCILLCANCHRELHNPDNCKDILDKYERWIVLASEEEKEKHHQHAVKIKNKNKRLQTLRNKQRQKRIQMILNSNVDFSKFGWSKRLEPIIGIKSNSIVRWMKNQMPDFYKNKCYKEKDINTNEITSIVNQYQTGKTISAISQELKIDDSRISTVLKENNFNLASVNAKTINMIDMYTNKILKTFNSIREAGIYCKENITTFRTNNPSLNVICRNISQCANRHRKTAYKYKWSFQNIN